MERVNVGRTFQFNWSKQKLRPACFVAAAKTFHPVRVSGYGHEQLLNGTSFRIKSQIIEDQIGFGQTCRA